MGTSNINRQIAGARSRQSGAFFEKMILDASKFYENKDIAIIEKTPEPMKIIKIYSRAKGQFIACFEKKAQPDFKGILEDGTMILFDAKSTSKDRIERSAVTTEQESCFEKYMKMGAMCFLVVTLNFESYYRIPWVVFRDMKKLYGHKYMSEEELAPYRLEYKNGYVKLLDGIELKGGRK